MTISSSGGVIAWAALYEGTYTEKTMPKYQPRGYAAELMECCRYFQAVVYPGTIFKVSDGILSAYGQFKVPMRIIPSIMMRKQSIELYSSQDVIFTATGNPSGSVTNEAIRYANIEGTFSVSVPNGFLKLNSDGILWANADL